jgi:hypothetical protein
VFGSVTALETDTLGRVFVLDGQAQEVKIFDSRGVHLTSIGRRGEGPGEFLRASGLNVDGNGHVWVWDPGNQRFSKFSVDGRLLHEVPRRVGGAVLPWRGELASTGQLIDWGLDFPERRSSTDLGRSTVFYPIRVDLAGGALDTLGPVVFNAKTDYEFRLPFRNSLTFMLTRGGNLWLGQTETYTLYRTTLAGDTTLVVSRFDVHPERVSQVERDSILALPDPLGEVTGERLNADWIPVYKPVLVQIVDDGAGHVIVFPRFAGQEPGTMIDVFREATGEYLGSVELPVRLETNPIPVATSRAILGVTRGDFDVPIVVRLELASAR